MTAVFIQKNSLLRESSFVETGHFTALPVVYKEKKEKELRTGLVPELMHGLWEQIS